MTTHRNQSRRTATRSANIDGRFIEPAYATDLSLLDRRWQRTEHRDLRVHQDRGLSDRWDVERLDRDLPAPALACAAVASASGTAK